jgi:hypothetical protein
LREDETRSDISTTRAAQKRYLRADESRFMMFFSEQRQKANLSRQVALATPTEFPSYRLDVRSPAAYGAQSPPALIVVQSPPF